jgi:hypothetical protein
MVAAITVNAEAPILKGSIGERVRKRYFHTTALRRLRVLAHGNIQVEGIEYD